VLEVLYSLLALFSIGSILAVRGYAAFASGLYDWRDVLVSPFCHVNRKWP